LTAIGRSLLKTPVTKGGLVVEALVAARRDPDVAALMGAHLAAGNGLLTDLIEAGQERGVVDPSVSPEALSRFCSMLLLGSLLLSPARLPAVDRGDWADLIGRLAAAFAPGA